MGGRRIWEVSFSVSGVSARSIMGTVGVLHGDAGTIGGRLGYTSAWRFYHSWCGVPLLV